MKNITLQHIIFAYVVAVNLLAFIVYGIDKHKAKRSKWRISEYALLMLAVVGGSVGAWLGMKVWHHKTLHKKFKFGVPLILIVQIAIIILCSCTHKTNDFSPSIVHVSSPKIHSKPPSCSVSQMDNNQFLAYPPQPVLLSKVIIERYISHSRSER